MQDRRTDVALVDAGEGRRLERFGPRLVDRPAPVALGPKVDPTAWADVDLRYDAGEGWSGPARSAEPWAVEVQGLMLELRTTASGGVGLYPEHAANLGWLEARIRERLPGSPGGGRSHPEVGPVTVLNLFAHTGVATLAAARAGAEIAHVDAARAAVAWARRNAVLSGLQDRPIRWLVDDALAFAEREGRRRRRYSGFVIDPPSFGRAEGGGRWRLRDDLTSLLDACARLSSDDPFVLLTAHTTGLDPEPTLAALAGAFGRRPGEPSAHRLGLTAGSGALLELGWAIRLG